MTSIRKLLAAGTGTVALCAVIAFALAPVTVLAEGTHQWGFWRGAALSFKSSTPTAVTLSPECSAALQTIKAAHDQDRIEDAQERVAAIEALWVKARDACAPQLATKVAPPASGATQSAACLAAIQQVKAAWARKDYAGVRSLWTTVKTACGFSSGEGFSFQRR